MLGPQTLAMELYADPAGVKRAAMEAAALFNQVLDVQLDMLHSAGLAEGTVDWMVTWLPGRGVCYSEDFAALCGGGHFREFFIEPNALIMHRLDSPMLHLHSGALACLDAVLTLPNLKALELSNDPNGPDIDQLLAGAQRVQATGLPLQLSNWERPLARKTIERTLRGLRPQGLKITLQAGTLDEAWALHEMVRRG
jgi:hypothetical protein